jgi:ferredoxin
MGTLRIEPVGAELEVRDGESILEALKRYGYSMFVGCRRGGCGVCLVEVEGGQFALRPHAVSLIPDDRHTLACRAEPLGECVVRMSPSNRLQRSVMRAWMERALSRSAAEVRSGVDQRHAGDTRIAGGVSGSDVA